MSFHAAKGFKKVGQVWTVFCECGWTDDRSETRVEAENEHALHVRLERASEAEARGASRAELIKIMGS